LRCIFSAIAAAWSAKLPPAQAMRAPFGRGACKGDGVGGADHGRAARIALVLRLAEQIVERLRGIVEGTRPGLDQPRQIRRNERLGEPDRMRLAILLMGVFGEGVGQVDDRVVAQRPGAPFRTIDDNFHHFLLLSRHRGSDRSRSTDESRAAAFISGLPVQPDVFHAPAIVYAVHL
jgi:hypothetical protein